MATLNLHERRFGVDLRKHGVGDVDPGAGGAEGREHGALGLELGHDCGICPREFL